MKNGTLAARSSFGNHIANVDSILRISTLSKANYPSINALTAQGRRSNWGVMFSKGVMCMHSHLTYRRQDQFDKQRIWTGVRIWDSQQAPMRDQSHDVMTPAMPVIDLPSPSPRENAEGRKV
jgi:hypothetical protein